MARKRDQSGTVHIRTKKDSKNHSVKVAHFTTIPSMTVKNVLVNGNVEGEVLTQSYPYFSRNQNARSANAIVTCAKGKPFYVQMVNFQSTAITLSKHMYVAIATPDPIIFDNTVDQTHNVVAVDEVADGTPRKGTSWELRVTICEEFEEHGDENLLTFEAFRVLELEISQPGSTQARLFHTLGLC